MANIDSNTNVTGNINPMDETLDLVAAFTPSQQFDASGFPLPDANNKESTMNTVVSEQSQINLESAFVKPEVDLQVATSYETSGFIQFGVAGSRGLTADELRAVGQMQHWLDRGARVALISSDEKLASRFQNGLIITLPATTQRPALRVVATGAIDKMRFYRVEDYARHQFVNRYGKTITTSDYGVVVTPIGTTEFVRAPRTPDGVPFVNEIVTRNPFANATGLRASRVGSGIFVYGNSWDYDAYVSVFEAAGGQRGAVQGTDGWYFEGERLLAPVEAIVSESQQNAEAARNRTPVNPYLLLVHFVANRKDAPVFQTGVSLENAAALIEQGRINAANKEALRDREQAEFVTRQVNYATKQAQRGGYAQAGGFIPAHNLDALPSNESLGEDVKAVLSAVTQPVKIENGFQPTTGWSNARPQNGGGQRRGWRR